MASRDPALDDLLKQVGLDQEWFDRRREAVVANRRPRPYQTADLSYTPERNDTGRRYIVSRYLSMPGSPALDTSYEFLICHHVGDTLAELAIDFEEAAGSGRDPLALTLEIVLGDEYRVEDRVIWRDSFSSTYWGTLRLQIDRKLDGMLGLLKLRFIFNEATLADIAGMVATFAFTPRVDTERNGYLEVTDG